jgi:hypothetical protein
LPHGDERLQRAKAENSAPFAVLHDQTQEHVKGINVVKVFVIALLLAVVGAFGFVATWEMASPLAPVEALVPDDRFHR